MSGAKNSIISDPLPYLPPEAPKKPERPKPTDWAKLGRSRKYPLINQQFEARKEYFRHFTPDGEAFSKMYAENPEAAARWAAIASEVIKELDDMQYRIELEARKQ